jgi:uncharacterized protein
MFTYTGKTALITGASMGIGRAFALELAKRGMSVILVARSEDKLRALASEITQTYNTRAEVIVADLSQLNAAAEVYKQVEQRKLTVDMLINNAGLGFLATFEAQSAAQDQQQIMVNIAALVDLTRAFIPSLLRRPGETAIINVASLASFQPSPYMAVYSATKAFVLSFTEALAEEHRSSKLRIQALCPGATETPFFDTAGQGASGRATRRTAEQVVATGLRALERNQVVAVDGAQNAWLAEAHRFFPRWLVTRLMASIIHAPEAAQTPTSARSHS